ncbi:AcrB/AcrD/AcrF family protein [Helicobacter cholecystus]|uniref:AcrB/AcrD/AcrF family protein n=1 Tax=Helicobacter cholecystus TaxID=45498 RepID=A0A3D8IWY8_9HELI|nr:efflux RND transporter permease subunit [Helicobacter cholecystus]RDU69476.1 AcrB/AcrD/AcrF family protein [Helicobacter cholecystus]VEJ24026.1 transmembrane Acr-type transport protein [Helicobacter cholecystus]
MNLLKSAIKNPVVMLVGVVFIFLFGSLALKSIPYQLIPQVSRPIVSVYTSWSNANVYEIEAEVIVPQEKALKSLAGLQVMTSIAREGRGSINLEFEEGSNLDTILLDISQKLGEIRSYPEGVNRPIIKGSGESVPPSIYLFLHSLNPDRSVEDERVFFVNEIAPFLERIKGVGEVSVLGGRDEQMQILLDTKLLAYNNITINEVIVAISKANKNTSAGILDYSSRAYRIRVDSKFSSIDDIYNVVIKSERGRNILLRDLADVKEGFAKSQVYSFHNNEDAISVRIHPSVNTNVLELTEAVRKEVTRLNENILKPQGLSLEWSRDQEGYILEAIDLVKENLLYGILFSCLVLLIFLRQMSSVLIVTFVILLSTFGTFIVLYIFNRTLNIVSLAGISFAISMLVDNAIVVLENIHQHRLKAKSLFQSALDGTYEVAGAIFASVLTTVAIFIPILGLKSESGQLFFDIALASTSALLISLFISLFIIPMLVCEFEKLSLLRWDIKKFWDFIFTPLEYGGRGFYFVMHKALNFFLKNWLRRLLCIFGFSAMSVYLYFVLMPKISYLPHGDQNFAIAYLSIPPGLSYQERKGIAKEIYEKNKHYLSINGYKGEKQGIAAIKDLFFIGSDSFMMIGAIAEDKSKIEMMSKKLQQDISSIPSVRGSVFQQGIFDGGNGGLSVDLYINGHNLDTLRANAEEIIEKIKEKIPKANVRAVPTLEINNKEIAFYPDLQALALNGLDAKSFGEVISTILSGKVIGEFQTPSGRNIDLILKSNNYNQIAPEDLSYAQIYTPQGNIVSLYSLAQIKEQYGLTQIRHYERERSYLLIILPPKDMDLESVIKIIKKEILPTVDLGENKVLLKGSANELEKTSLDLLGGFALAVVITYLLLCALYGNFIYPFVIIFTLPFAVVGGFIGLKLTNLFIAPQPLDVLGMLGMIILVGSVVNNAILIVYQSLINIRNYGLRPYEAVLNATLSRMRPIYMSMLTSVCGLLPLVIFSGSGSEIYRGLGAVIIGGLVFSTLISLFVIPSLLLFFIQREKAQKGGGE